VIEKLLLHNFQKWGTLEIDFDPYLTILYGKSGLGKSCALRGLTWVCLNEPRGDRYIRRGTKECSSSLTLDGQTIKRYRTPTSNGYEYDGQIYEALNGDVPSAISNLLRLNPSSFSDQFDGPYWLLLSKPEVARQLNSIVNLDLIDRTLESLSLSARRAKDRVTESSDNLVAAKQKRDDLAWVKDADTKLKEIEEAEEKRGKTEKDLSVLSSILDRLEEKEHLLLNGEKEMRRLLKILDVGDRLVFVNQQLSDLKQKISALERGEGYLDGINKEWTEIQERLADYTKENCPICGQTLN
jgi:DNA repair ATPase RecN